MKKHLISRSFILLPVALVFLQCSKMETSPAPEAQKLSFSDTVTAKAKLKPQDQKDTTEKIAHYIANDYLSAQDLKTIPMNERKFHYQAIDLNGDGKMEVFVGFSTPYFCGTGGCAMVLLDAHLKPISKFTVTRPPLYADAEMNNGWKTLYVKDGEQWKALRYENGTYPSNPSVLPDASKGPGEQAEGIFADQPAEHRF